MSCVREMRIFSAEQIVVPDEFPKILKDYTKEIVRKSPEDVIKFSKGYFEALLKERGYFDDHLDKLNVTLHNFIVRKKSESIYDHYTIDGVIGDPSDSKARLGTHKKTGIQRAIKIVYKSTIEDLDEYNKKVALLQQLDHPNIIRYLEIFEDDYNFYFVSEYMAGGDLWNGVMSYGGSYTEEITATVIKQLLQASAYLHKKGIVHRNIRTGNILFAEAGKLAVKLIDFDVAGTKSMEATKIYGGGYFGPYYCAPEIFRSEYNEKCDIWSIGITLYFLLFGDLPFYHYDHQEAIKLILKGQYSLDGGITKKISFECLDLLQMMLRVDVNERISAEQALLHPWFQKAKKGELKGKDLGNSLDNIKGFTAGGKLKQALLGFFVQNLLSQQEINTLAEQFKQFDVNGNGTLSPQELKAALKEFKGIDYNEKDVDDIIKKIDADNDGEINYSEWLMSAMNKDALLASDRLDNAFKMLDVDGDGELSVEEIKGMLEVAKTVDEDMVLRAMNEIDHTHKKTIKLNEFKIMIQKLFE